MRSGILAAVAAAATLLALTPAAEAAAPAVQITKVYYDSPGADLRSNSSLNAEYVVLKNTTRATIQLEEWTLRDRTGYEYEFGRFSLRPGRTVTVRTGKGRDTSMTVYWNRRQYVWNNDRDTAGIYRGSDLRRIDTCSWSREGRGYLFC